MWLAVVLLACALSASALNNGLNTKPALGFNTYVKLLFASRLPAARFPLQFTA
jgi:hypothetical protein